MHAIEQITRTYALRVGDKAPHICQCLIAQYCCSVTKVKPDKS